MEILEPKISIVDLAYQIIDMHKENQKLRADLEYYRPYEQKYLDALNHSIAHNQQMIGSMLTAVLDPNSVINKGHQKLAEDAASGESA